MQRYQCNATNATLPMQRYQCNATKESELRPQAETKLSLVVPLLLSEGTNGDGRTVPGRSQSLIRCPPMTCATSLYGFVPTAQWKGVEMKNVPSVSACFTAALHSAASSPVRVGKMPP